MDVSFEHDFSALSSGSRAEIHDVVAFLKTLTDEDLAGKTVAASGGAR